MKLPVISASVQLKYDRTLCRDNRLKRCALPDRSCFSVRKTYGSFFAGRIPADDLHSVIFTLQNLSGKASGTLPGLFIILQKAPYLCHMGTKSGQVIDDADQRTDISCAAADGLVTS